MVFNLNVSKTIQYTVYFGMPVSSSLSWQVESRKVPKTLPEGFYFG